MKPSWGIGTSHLVASTLRALKQINEAVEAFAERMLL